MTVSSTQSGSQTATLDTEHQLGSTITTAGIYCLVVDTSNMTTTDKTILRAKTKCRSGDTSRLAFYSTFLNNSGNAYSPPVPIDTEVLFTLEQTDGTGRAFPWNILNLGGSCTSSASGSQTATVTTEHTLGSEITVAGTYMLVVDTANMVNGDTLELRVKTKCKSGSSAVLHQLATFADVQVTPNKYSMPVPIDTGVTFTLKQTTGTGRAFPWNVLKVG